MNLKLDINIESYTPKCAACTKLLKIRVLCPNIPKSENKGFKYRKWKEKISRTKRGFKKLHLNWMKG